MPKKSGTDISELKIGPFAGGMNTYSDQSAIADNELVDCVNFDIDLDGSLKSRPPWTLLHHDHNETSKSGVVPSSHQLILGCFVYEGVQFVIFLTNHTGTYQAYTYYIGGSNDGTTAKIADGVFSGAVRYADDVYLCPGTEGAANTTILGTGYKYSLNDGLVTAIPNMPLGYARAIYKDRLWICGRRGLANSSRLFFSALADVTSWPSQNFFDINPGDGDASNDLCVYQDNLMVFKDNATYVLSYNQGPAQAVLQVVNNSIGAMGPRSVVTYENSIFILQYNQVYEMVNFNFTRVSVKVPFEYDGTTPYMNDTQALESFRYPFFLSLVGDRLFVRFYNRMYVYHLRLRAWTRWESADESIQYLGPIVQLDNTNTDLLRGYEQYVATSCLDKVTDPNGLYDAMTNYQYVKIFIMEDRYESSVLEGAEDGYYNYPLKYVDISCSMLTKTYDMGLSHRFKRIMHWGVDTITGRNVTGIIYPYSVAYKVSWADLHTKMWNQLNTWAYPLFEIPNVSQPQPVGSGLSRRYVRFPKSLRFRLIQFKVSMLTSGNTSDGPARLYSVTAFIGGKQLAGKVVN